MKDTLGEREGSTYEVVQKREKFKAFACRIEVGAYTDDKCTNEGSWQSQLVPVGHETATNNGGCVASKSELKRQGEEISLQVREGVAVDGETHTGHCSQKKIKYQLSRWLP